MTDQVDDDVRRMLRHKAGEIQVPGDAWDTIAARIQKRPARTIGRRLALAGAAAAAVAGTVVVANLPGSSNVATAPPTTGPPAAIAPSSLDPVVVATEWVRERVPDADLVAGEFRDAGDGNGSVLFLEGEVQTEVGVRQRSGGEGWGVVAAASDMMPAYDLAFDGKGLSGHLAVEAAGALTITYIVDGKPVGEHLQQVAARGDVELGYRSDERGQTAGIRAVLVTGGTTYLMEVTGIRATDPPIPTGSFVAIWPATDSVGLAGLQRQADAGERPDLLDPQELAWRFLTDQGVDGFSTLAFQQGDNSSGEVPYRIEGGASGTVLLRRTGGEGSVWYVTGVTSDDLRIEATRREETHLVADVWSDVDGTLTWTGATPVEVRSGETVSIGRPDTPTGSYPVVIHLTDGDRTLAIAARLG